MRTVVHRMGIAISPSTRRIQSHNVTLEVPRNAPRAYCVAGSIGRSLRVAPASAGDRPPTAGQSPASILAISSWASDGVEWAYVRWIITSDEWPRTWASMIGFMPRLSAHVA